MTIILGYARVSTANQSTDNQIETLKLSGCTEVFYDDAVSGTRNQNSPHFRALMARVAELREQGKPVTVRVTKLDRWSRSMKALLEGIEELGELGASFEALDGLRYDAGNPYSELMLHTLGALAQFERSLIKSRMADGMAAKVAKGMIRGNKPKLTSAQVKAIHDSYNTGTKTDRELADDFRVSRSTIGRVLGIHGFEAPYVTLDQWEAAKKKASS